MNGVSFRGSSLLRNIYTACGKFKQTNSNSSKIELNFLVPAGSGSCLHQDQGRDLFHQSEFFPENARRRDPKQKV